jgi:hypothetical protein
LGSIFSAGIIFERGFAAATFLGFGSLGDATGYLKDLLKPTPLVTNVTHGLSNNATLGLNKIAQTLSNAAQSSANVTHGLSNNATLGLTKIAHALNATQLPTITTTTSSSTSYFTNFIIYGVAGLVAAIVALRVISYIYLGFKEKRYKLSQEKYYKEEFKEDMAKSLFYFFLDLKDLFNRHYENNYDEDILTWNYNQVKSFILHNILPPDDLQWAVQQEDNKSQGGQ